MLLYPTSLFLFPMSSTSANLQPAINDRSDKNIVPDVVDVGHLSPAISDRSDKNIVPDVVDVG